MADSDEDSERRRSRDKFRRERSDVENRRKTAEKREPFDDRMASGGGTYPNSRSRQEKRGSGDCRPFSGYRDRPIQSNEPQNKRPRRDWNDDFRSSYRQKDVRSAAGDDDSNYRPPLMPFKRFLDPLDDLITEEEAISKYKEYKEAFNKRYIEEFFEAHKTEEWLREKYHPDHIDIHREQIAKNIRHRLDVFLDLFDKGFIDNQAVQVDNSEKLIRLMDAVVIKLSGGTDDDLAALDNPDIDSTEEYMSDHEGEKRSNKKDLHSDHGAAKSEEGEEDSDFESEDGEEKKLKSDFRRAKAALISQENDALLPIPGNLKSPTAGGWTGVCVSNSESDTEGGVSRKSKVSISVNQAMDDEFNGSLNETVQQSLGALNQSTLTSSNVEAKRTQQTHESLSKPIDAKRMEFSESIDEEDDLPTPTTAEAPDGGGTNIINQTKLAESTVASAAAILSSPSTAHPLSSLSNEKNTIYDEKRSVVRNLHKTVSVFFRCLPPSITQKELEELCASQPGFLRLAIYDPMPERNFTRHAWATYRADVNIKKVCWALNTSPLLHEKMQSTRSAGELCATVNRELAQRVRPVTPLTRHKPVMRNDLILASRLIAQLDAKHNLWPLVEPNEVNADGQDEVCGDEKSHELPKTCPVPGLPGVFSANPLMRNLTDYLIDETGEEEAMLMGNANGVNAAHLHAADRENDESTESPEKLKAQPIEVDQSLSRALDRLLIYLRIVYSIDYYSATIYQLEDLMPHRCGIFHARGDRGIHPGFHSRPHGYTVIQRDVNEYIEGFNVKIAHLLESPSDLTDSEVAALGARDAEKAAEDFIEANIQKRTSKKKPFKVVWICPLSNKKFREPIFVRKHILNKHMDKVEAAKKDNAIFFNNFLRDPRRPSLPEAPKNLIHQYYPPGPSHNDRNSGMGYGGGGRGRNYGGGYRPGGYRGGAGYRNNMGNSTSFVSSQYGQRGRGQGMHDFYDASAQQQQQPAMAAAAAAAAALYPNNNTADLYAIAAVGALGAGNVGASNSSATGIGTNVRSGSGVARGGSPRGDYVGARNYSGDYNRKRAYGDERSRPTGGNRGVISYNDLDEPGNDGY